MRTVLFCLLLTLSSLLSVAAVSANDYGYGYSNGYVHDGYTYQTGYWYLNGVAYSRSQYKCYTCRRGWYWCYKYYPVQVVAQSAVTGGDALKSKMLDIAKQRDAYEGTARLSAIEHAEVMEFADKLGLSNFAWQGYGMAPPPYAGYAASYLNNYSQLPVAQGATVFGYQEIANLYSNTDLGQLYNMALRLGSDQQAYAQEATINAQALVDQLGSRAAAIEEIKAKGAVAAQVLNATKAADQLTIVKQGSQQGGGVTVQPNDVAAQGQNLRRLQAIFETNCTACHKPGAQDTKLDLTNMANLTVELQDKIWVRINHPDPTKRMPKAADGGVSAPLSDEDKRFIAWMFQPPQ